MAVTDAPHARAAAVDDRAPAVRPSTAPRAVQPGLATRPTTIGSAPAGSPVGRAAPTRAAATSLGATATTAPQSANWASAAAAVPRPTRPRVSFGAMRALHTFLARNRVWDAVAGGLESSPILYRAFTAAEKAVKSRLFGCRMCAQCALPSTAYACPMTCPKQLRNGPCGGVAPDGSCEVYPGTRCVWLIAYERAEEDGRVADLRRLQRPIDQRKWGESSWVNYWRGRDDGLWTEDASAGNRRLDLPILPSSAPR